MGTGRPIKPLILSEGDQAKLEMIARRPKTDQRTALRARIVRAWARGASNQKVAASLHVTAQTVGTWRERFRTGGLGALGARPRSGPPRKITAAKVEEVVTRTLEKKPRQATHWSTRTMAAASALRCCPAGKGSALWLSRSARLARLWAQAAFAGKLQALHRPLLCGEGARYRRPVFEPAGANSRRGALCG